MMELAHTLKALRKKHGWTQQQLAERAGIKRSLVGAYEEG
ncbi:MAG TPA: transcriptional regulator, partial [Cryomorphaceae bacterium]|nr:transcriptional regulator [Cryomorphaceae bacterium]